ncbi:MAG: hypothetical protein JXA93_03580 [Anaerolineae bacterium]|nr:hypothetical protein [Anaerolineae bacterium]
MESYWLCFDLLTDATFGRGEGLAGLVDQEVDHDRLGLPYLKGRTLKGLLNEECANILYVIERNGMPTSRWHQAAQRLLGGPGSSLAEAAHLRVGPARMPADLRREVRKALNAPNSAIQPADILESLTAIRRQTAVDERTGAPDEHTLRAMRVVLRRTCFEALLTFPLGTKPDDLPLLAACILALRRAGTGRNRGRGKLQASLWTDVRGCPGVEITSQQFQVFARDFRRTAEVEPEGNDRKITEAENSKEPVDFPVPCVLTYEIEAQQPLLLTRIEGDPNSSVSYPYIPGSAIRGALIARYLASSDASLDLAAPVKGKRSLFFDGSTRFLNAYPLDRFEKRTLPTPLSWVREKGTELEGGAEIYDLAVEDIVLDEPKAVGVPFCRVFPPSNSQDLDSDVGTALPIVEFAVPRWQINVHTARNRVKGRAIGSSTGTSDDQGAVFRYQSIAAGQRFGGVILVSNADDLKVLRDLLADGDLWVGRSRSAGYGRVCILNVQEPDNWREVETEITDLKPGAQVVITLLSDIILRHAGGAYADTLPPELLPAPLNAALKADGAFKAVEPVGGFNRKWGLPLDQVPAMGAGSTFRFRAEAFVLADALRKIEAAGLGERRAEGFGRVAIACQPQEPILEVRKVYARPEKEKPELLSRTSQDLAKKMVERLWRRDLDRRLAEYIQKRKLSEPYTWPSNAQLSRLRSLTLNALPAGKAAIVSDFLKALRSRAREQYERARVDDRRLVDWLQDWVDDPNNIWTVLDPDQSNLARPVIGGVEAAKTDRMATEYTLRLVAGIMHRAAKERLAEERRAKEQDDD